MPEKGTPTTVADFPSISAPGPHSLPVVTFVGKAARATGSRECVGQQLGDFPIPAPGTNSPFCGLSAVGREWRMNTSVRVFIYDATRVVDRKNWASGVWEEPRADSGWGAFRRQHTLLLAAIMALRILSPEFRPRNSELPFFLRILPGFGVTFSLPPFLFTFSLHLFSSPPFLFPSLFRLPFSEKLTESGRVPQTALLGKPAVAPARFAVQNVMVRLGERSETDTRRSMEVVN
jgi:hypothetical protein